MLQYNAFGVLDHNAYPTLITSQSPEMEEKKREWIKYAMCNDKRASLISVLMVDHSGSFLRTAKECLAIEGGLKIETALSVEEAIVKLRQKKTDVIVSEIIPSDVKFEFLKAFQDENKSTPIIVFTIEEESSFADEARKMGASGFVEKYGNPSQVFSTLKKCIVSVVETKLNSSSQETQ